MVTLDVCGKPKMGFRRTRYKPSHKRRTTISGLARAADWFDLTERSSLFLIAETRLRYTRTASSAWRFHTMAACGQELTAAACCVTRMASFGSTQKKKD